MKWTKPLEYKNILEKEGSRRKKTRFLFLPKTIIQNGLEIIRWLEKATWSEKYNFTYFGTLRSEIEFGQRPSKYAVEEGKWTATHWMDIEETAEQALKELPLL